MADLTSLFTTPFTAAPAPTATLPTGYASSALDLLLGQSQRSQATAQSKLVGYTQAENDPNFSRAAPNNAAQLSQSASMLSLATKSTSLTTATGAMVGVSQFLPANIRTLLLNFKALQGTNVNANATTKQATMNQATTNSVLADIQGLFSGGMSFTTIAAMAAAVAGISVAALASNSSAAALLPLPVYQILPNSMTSIYADANYLSTVDNIVGSSEAATLTQQLTQASTTLANTPLSNIVTASNYQDATVTLEDPLGLALQAQLQNEILMGYTAAITNVVTSSPLVTDPTEQQTIISLVVADANTNIQTAFKGNLGLPSLSTVAKGVIAVSHNNTIQAVLDAHNIFTTNLLTQIGIVSPPAGVTPIDHLMNLKNNLNARLNMNKIGTTTAAYIALEAYLVSNLINPDTSTPTLQLLYNNIVQLLNEDTVIC